LFLSRVLPGEARYRYEAAVLVDALWSPRPSEDLWDDEAEMGVRGGESLWVVQSFGGRHAYFFAVAGENWQDQGGCSGLVVCFLHRVNAVQVDVHFCHRMDDLEQVALYLFVVCDFCSSCFPSRC